MAIRTFCKLLLVAFAATLLAGCEEERLTFERWNLIHDGMTPIAVEESIGEPWHKLPDRWVYEDTDRHISAKVYFNADGTKVICKQWYDPDNGWHGKNPDELDNPPPTGSTIGSSTGSGTIDH